MSKNKQPNSSKNEEHGTTASYIIGFVLSLVFTAIPYYMVVNKTLSGSALLLIIMVIAVLQMIIQIVFFLHLGRGPKPLYNVVFFVATVGLILVVVGGSVFIMNNLHYNMAPADVDKHLIEKEGIHQVEGQETGACQGKHTNHKVTIKDGTVTPARVEAKRCDTLTFISEDDDARQIGFGSHPNHDGYAGQADIIIYKGRHKAIVLSEEGDYDFHDHLDPNVFGKFSVAPEN